MPGPAALVGERDRPLPALRRGQRPLVQRGRVECRTRQVHVGQGLFVLDRHPPTGLRVQPQRAAPVDHLDEYPALVQAAAHLVVVPVQARVGREPVRRTPPGPHRPPRHARLGLRDALGVLLVPRRHGREVQPGGELGGCHVRTAEDRLGLEEHLPTHIVRVGSGGDAVAHRGAVGGQQPCGIGQYVVKIDGHAPILSPAADTPTCVASPAGHSSIHRMSQKLGRGSLLWVPWSGPMAA